MVYLTIYYCEWIHTMHARVQLLLAYYTALKIIMIAHYSMHAYVQRRRVYCFSIIMCEFNVCMNLSYLSSFLIFSKTLLGLEYFLLPNLSFCFLCVGQLAGVFVAESLQQASHLSVHELELLTNRIIFSFKAASLFSRWRTLAGSQVPVDNIVCLCAMPAAWCDSLTKLKTYFCKAVWLLVSMESR